MIYIYGSGGRGILIKELLIRLGKRSKEITLIDDFKKKFKKTNYLLKNFNKKKDYLFIGISNPKIQKEKYTFFKKKLKNRENKPLIDPNTIIKTKTKIGKNTIILENSSIGPNVTLAKNVFVGSRVVINHDCNIDSFSTIGHGCNLAGNVSVKKNCIIGISSTIQQRINIGSNVTIGSASNVINNCKGNKIYYGNPAKIKKKPSVLSF